MLSTLFDIIGGHLQPVGVKLPPRNPWQIERWL